MSAETCPGQLTMYAFVVVNCTLKLTADLTGTAGRSVDSTALVEQHISVSTVCSRGLQCWLGAQTLQELIDTDHGCAPHRTAGHAGCNTPHQPTHTLFSQQLTQQGAPAGHLAIDRLGNLVGRGKQVSAQAGKIREKAQHAINQAQAESLRTLTMRGCAW